MANPTRQCCTWGAECYRVCAQHKARFAHPSDPDWQRAYQQQSLGDRRRPEAPVAAASRAPKRIRTAVSTMGEGGAAAASSAGPPPPLQQQLPLRIIATADTHGNHEELGGCIDSLVGGCGDDEQPVLVLAGDTEPSAKFCAWLKQRAQENARLKIVMVLGDHDKTHKNLQDDPAARHPVVVEFARQRLLGKDCGVAQTWEQAQRWTRAIQHQTNVHSGCVIKEAVLLHDSGVRIGNEVLWGSAYHPNKPDSEGQQAWCFQESENKLAERFMSIPPQTTVLVTHGPPRGCLDRAGGSFVCVHRRTGADGGAVALKELRSAESGRCGSTALAMRVEQLASLKLHIFGHVHASQNDELTQAGQTSDETPRSKISQRPGPPGRGALLSVNAAAEQLVPGVKWRLADDNPYKPLRSPFVLRVGAERQFRVDRRGKEAKGGGSKDAAVVVAVAAACVLNGPSTDPIGDGTAAHMPISHRTQQA